MVGVRVKTLTCMEVGTRSTQILAKDGHPAPCSNRSDRERRDREDRRNGGLTIFAIALALVKRFSIMVGIGVGVPVGLRIGGQGQGLGVEETDRDDARY